MPKIRPTNQLNVVELSLATLAGPRAFLDPGVCTSCWRWLAFKPEISLAKKQLNLVDFSVVTLGGSRRVLWLHLFLSPFRV